MVFGLNTGKIKQRSALVEYKKNPKVTAKDIQQFREWLERQPHLPFKEITDLDLILMYHACQYSMEVSKQTLDLNFSLRTLYTSLFKERCLDAKIENALDVVAFTALEGHTTNGATILYAGIIEPDAKRFIMLDLFKAFFMVMDLCQYEEGTWPSMALLVDVRNMQLSHLGQFDPITVQRGFNFLQEAYPVHLTEFHFMNAPTFMDRFMLLLRPVLKKELQDLIKIHPIGSNSIYEHIPKKSLPSDAGGEYKSWDELRKETWVRMQTNKDFFENENKKRVNETLRPANSKMPIGYAYGLEGNFKKLDLD